MMTKVFCEECGKNIIETDYPDWKLIIKKPFLNFEVYKVLDRDTILNPPPVAWYEIRSEGYPKKFFCSDECFEKGLGKI